MIEKTIKRTRKKIEPVPEILNGSVSEKVDSAVNETLIPNQTAQELSTTTPPAAPTDESSSQPESVAEISEKKLRPELEVLFIKKELLSRALTHKSHVNEMKTNLEHNEKFEFLGDAVLDMVIGEILYEKFPADSEGNLSKKRASVVNEEVLSEMALKIGLEDLLLLGKGERLTGGALKPRLLASAFEAIVGALFLDRGYGEVREFVRSQFAKKIDSLHAQVDFEKDYKTRLQELVQQNLKETPVYEMLAEKGRPHERVFRVCVRLKDKVLAEGTGKSKKAAEQAAAHLALQAHQELYQVPLSPAKAKSSADTNSGGPLTNKKSQKFDLFQQTDELNKETL